MPTLSINFTAAAWKTADEGKSYTLAFQLPGRPTTGIIHVFDENNNPIYPAIAVKPRGKFVMSTWYKPFAGRVEVQVNWKQAIIT